MKNTSPNSGTEKDSRGPSTEKIKCPFYIIQDKRGNRGHLIQVYSFLRSSVLFCFKDLYFIVVFFFFFFFLAVSHSLWDLSSPIRDWTWAMAVSTLSLNHWTAKEFPRNIFKGRIHTELFESQSLQAGQHWASYWTFLCSRIIEQKIILPLHSEDEGKYWPWRAYSLVAIQ